jgi:hypothetical protein|tara:strand:- start:467 stop:685 length:219 start_codon:yes stop_codon:yes gene_type:complete
MNKRTEWLLKPSPLFSFQDLNSIRKPPTKIIKQHIAPGTITSSSNPTFQSVAIKPNTVDPQWYWKSLRPVLP